MNILGQFLMTLVFWWLMLPSLLWGEVGNIQMVEVEASSELSSPGHSCPQNLLKIQNDLEEILQYVSSNPFKETMRKAVAASIPEAIRQADGLRNQIAFLRKEIIEQDRFQRDAEQIARFSAKQPSGPLAPCPPGEKGSYCSAVERSYISSASNLANRAFLEALECYQRQGIR